MDSDKTMKIVTNLDRSGVEGLLGEIRSQGLGRAEGLTVSLTGAPSRCPRNRS